MCGDVIGGLVDRLTGWLAGWLVDSTKIAVARLVEFLLPDMEISQSAWVCVKVEVLQYLYQPIEENIPSATTALASARRKGNVGLKPLPHTTNTVPGSILSMMCIHFLSKRSPPEQARPALSPRPLQVCKPPVLRRVLQQKVDVPRLRCGLLEAEDMEPKRLGAEERNVGPVDDLAFER